MKLFFKLITFFLFSVFSLNVFAQQGDIGIRMMSGAKKGFSSVSGSNLFKGETSVSSSPEFFGRLKLSNFSSSIPENLMIEGYISPNDESVHDIKFNGASLGKKTCSNTVGANLQWWFGEKESNVRPYVGLGFESRDCSGEYALGGTKFSQSEKNPASGVVHLGIKFDLSDWVAKGLSVNVNLRTSGKHTSRGVPVAGTEVSNETGGGTILGVGLQYSF